MSKRDRIHGVGLSYDADKYRSVEDVIAALENAEWWDKSDEHVIARHDAVCAAIAMLRDMSPRGGA